MGGKKDEDLEYVRGKTERKTEERSVNVTRIRDKHIQRESSEQMGSIKKK